MPAVGRAGQIALFCGIFCLIMTMYGGGFAAIPAYLADLLAVGFVCNALIRPVAPTDVEPEATGVAPRPWLAPVASPAAVTAMRPANLLLLAGFWLFVAIPMGWGLWATVRQTAVLFW